MAYAFHFFRNQRQDKKRSLKEGDEAGASPGDEGRVADIIGKRWGGKNPVRRLLTVGRS